ncbi:small ribosomal subunit protein bS20c [Magnolia sinica]|uniref:small ribosomal subunit protein bS20c n=1 Tax=Magnolia sinica TaxID=86752 RepID=UPI00265AB614|nr:small ribosomal subunit protein bS20c [Magnolia sinica]
MAILLHHCFSSSVIALPSSGISNKPKSCLSSVSGSRSSCFSSLSFSNNLSLSQYGFLKGGLSMRPIEGSPRRQSIVCDAAPGKKPDSAEKRARQAEKRRLYNKAKKSEVKTRMKKVFESLDALKKKTEVQAEEILPVEKLIAEAYSAIDKAVKAGTLHRNTGAHRKSRLARRKKAVEIHHGWYTPAATA